MASGRLQGLLLAARGNNPEPHLRQANDALHTFGAAPDRARTQHALADWLTTHQRTIDAQPLYAAARAIYQQLNAQAWLDQLDLACPTISST